MGNGSRLKPGWHEPRGKINITFDEGIQVGYACPICKVFTSKPPEEKQLMCDNKLLHEEPERMHEMLWIERPDQDHVKILMDLEVFNEDQRHVLYGIVLNINKMWEKINKLGEQK